MAILPRLVALYESRGITIAAGLNPSHFGGFAEAAFTWFIKDGESLTNGLGIAAQEVYFLECLFDRFHPRSIFIIGNSLGWSTLAIALLNPAATVLAIDAGLDRNAQAGIAFTNRIAEEEGLAVRVVAGRSPDDVASILRASAMPPVEFAFIDGYHAVDQVALDFRAVRPHAAAGCVYLFHDVTTFRLAAGVEEVASEAGLAWRLLPGTTSGMAIAYNADCSPACLADIAPFATAPDTLRFIRDAAWRHRHRHLARWQRSLRKRVGGNVVVPSLGDGDRQSR